MFNRVLLSLSLIFVSIVSFGQMVSFKISMNHPSYVVNEPVELSVRLVNQGVMPIHISDYSGYKDNKLVIEIRNQKNEVLTPFRTDPLISELSLEKDEGELFKILLSEWFILPPAHYQIKVVLYCNGYRYSSPLEVFDVVPGFELAVTSHYISLHPAIERTLRLVYWSREGREIAFLRADDSPAKSVCRTLMLGDIVRVKRPSIEKVKNSEGVFYIYRQATRDLLVRNEIISDDSGIRISDTKRAVDSASSPVIDSLRRAVEKKNAEKR